MNYNNVNLWFAKDDEDKIVTIGEVNKEKHKVYHCPLCNSEVIPRQGDINSWCFAHVDKNKCSSESMIHWWIKNELIKQGDKFLIKIGDQIKEFICKQINIEQSYETSFGIYRPDITIRTEDDQIIYFELAKSNKKKIKNYIDIWNELNNIVVEVETKDLLNGNEVKIFKPIDYRKQKFDKETCRIAKKVCRKNNKDYLNYEQNLIWILNDCYKYINNIIDIEILFNEIFSLDEHWLYLDILENNSACNKIYSDIKCFEEKAVELEIIKLQEKYKENIKIIIEEKDDFYYRTARSIKNIKRKELRIYSNLFNKAFLVDKRYDDLDDEWTFLYSTSSIHYKNLNEYKSQIEKHLLYIQEIERRNIVLKSEMLQEVIKNINEYVSSFDKKYTFRRDKIETYEIEKKSSYPIDWQKEIAFVLEYNDLGISEIQRCFDLRKVIKINIDENVSDKSYDYLYNNIIEQINSTDIDYNTKFNEVEYKSIINVLNRLNENYNQVKSMKKSYRYIDFKLYLCNFRKGYIRFSVEETNIYTEWYHNRILIDHTNPSSENQKEIRYNETFNEEELYNVLSNVYSNRIRQIRYK